MPVSEKFVQALKMMREKKGSDLSPEEISQAHSMMPEEMAQAPAWSEGIDKVISERPLVKAFGSAKHAVENKYRELEEDYPKAMMAPNALLHLASLPAKALYGLEDIAAKTIDPEADLDKYRLSNILPKTAQSLQADPSVRDAANAALLMMGPKGVRAGEGTVAKAARRSYNATVDPIGSLLKLPEWQKAQSSARDATKKAAYEQKLMEKIGVIAEKEKPAPLGPEEMQMVSHLQNNEMLPLQLEASKRLENTLSGLKNIGRENAELASHIVEPQPFTLTDADIAALSKHPELASHPEIQRMAMNMAEREMATPKVTLPEGGMRQGTARAELTAGQKPPSQTVTFPEQEIDAVQANLLPKEYEGLYSTKQEVPQVLEQIVEQPPLRGQEDVAGSGGPYIIGEFGSMIHEGMRVPEGAEAPVLGKSTFTKEGVAIPKYELNPQENLQLPYASDGHIPTGFYGIRQAIDDKNWRVNPTTGQKESISPEAGAIANRMRKQYQESSAPLRELSEPQKLRIQKALEAKNALIEEANKLAVEKQAPIASPTTIGEATTLLNEDTVRALEQQKRLSPSNLNEKELSLADRMARGDDKALAEELRITRQHPELLEFAERMKRAKTHIKDVEKHEAKLERAKSGLQSIPYSRVTGLDNPDILTEFAKMAFFVDPIHAAQKYATFNFPRWALEGLGKVSENPAANKFLNYPRKISGPYGLINNAEKTYEGEQYE